MVESEATAPAGTSTAAFVGVAEKGPDDDALRVTSWEEFQKGYGSFVPASNASAGNARSSLFMDFNSSDPDSAVP